MRKGLTKDLIARVLGRAPKYTIAELEQKFPPRNFGGDALPTRPEDSGHAGSVSLPMVTRFAPSPTGYMHIGNLYGMMIDKKLAQQSGGVFYLRVEDTDTKREVSDAIDIILSAGKNFALMPDEYPSVSGENVGSYGPYKQSERKEIYHSVAAELLASGRAYPCFLSTDEMDEIREQQKSSGFPTGIYGEWARDRDLTDDEIIALFNSGRTPSIRLYSTGDKSKKTYCKDAVRGSIEFPQNDEDIVLIKSNDGLPTYHFAHLVDDHFMRTTHVVRGEEWLPSAPLHVQMFNMMGWGAPLYIHTSTLDTVDAETGKQRKLSKRKDPAANVAGFLTDGWPAESVLEYLFNIVASGYEEAKLKGQVENIWEWDLKIKKIPTSGALFDWKKLEWWAREFIATLSVDELVGRVVDWAREYSPDWAALINGNENYLMAMLSIERSDPKRIRKDFVTWKQTLEEVSYFWDDLFKESEEHRAKSEDKNSPSSCEGVDASEASRRGSDFEFNKNALSEFIAGFDINDDKETWWNKIKTIAENLSANTTPSADAATPSEKGIKPGDIAMNLRVALTGRTNTPDLYSVINVMGDTRVRERINGVIN